jgi:hypothetical protein
MSRGWRRAIGGAAGLVVLAAAGVAFAAYLSPEFELMGLLLYLCGPLL